MNVNVSYVFNVGGAGSRGMGSAGPIKLSKALCNGAGLNFET